MKCYVTSNSPYARKVKVVAFETGSYDEVEWLTITREERAELIPDINPLGKVPVAVLESGQVLCDSPVICAYVDSLVSDGNLIPKSNPERWKVLTAKTATENIFYSLSCQCPKSIKICNYPYSPAIVHIRRFPTFAVTYIL